MKVLMFGPNLMGGVLSVERLILAHGEGIEWIPTVHEGSRWKKSLSFLASTLRLLRPGAHEVVHIHFSSHGSTVRKAVLCLLARMTGRPVVLHAHGSGFREFFAALPSPLQALFAWVFRGCARFIALSGSWEAYYQVAFGLAPGQTVVLRNPVALPGVVPERRGREQLRLVFLGRIGERKGAFELIEAFSRLPGAPLLDLAGDGEGERALALAAELGVAERVRVHAWVGPAERDALLAAADVFVLPSRNEGLPMAMLEAMGWGVPVVVTPVGGIPELVRDGENGLLVPVGDVEMLTAACARLLKDEGLRLELGAAGRRDVEGLGAEAYAQALQAVYLTALRSAVTA